LHALLEKRRKTSHSSAATSSRRLIRDEELFDRSKFNIGILKPDLEYIMQGDN